MAHHFLPEVFGVSAQREIIPILYDCMWFSGETGELSLCGCC